MIYTYQHNEKTYTVRLEARADGTFSGKINGQPVTFEARKLEDNVWLLQIEGERVLVHTAANQDARFARADGHTYLLKVPDARRTRGGATGAAGDLSAEMPGQVIEVMVEAGQEVITGQTLMVLEAMKMEIRVNAPRPGTVRQVLVAGGDVVERGQLLIELSFEGET